MRSSPSIVRSAMPRKTLLVTGAAGNLGRQVVERLLEANAGPIVATTRTPDKLADLAKRGVEVRQADFTKPEGLVKAFTGAEEATWTLLTLAAVGLSWVVTHTAYTFRYAHMHYRRSRKHDSSDGGIQFSGTEEPSDIDFAYFSFTIGMCFQVSDVVVTTTRMRREVLLHAVLSFVYNTVILALAVNLAVNLMS